MNPSDLLTDQYRTPEDAGSVLGKLLPSLCYYSRMAAIVWRASRRARAGDYDDAAWAASSHEIIAALEGVGVRFAIEGREHLRDLPGPCVFIGNHMSTLETFVLPGLLIPFTRTTFVVKKSLTEYPVFRHVMVNRDPVVVERTNPREDFKVVMEEGGRRLADGISVVVFPQTTRTTAFDPEQFNTIGVKLAKRAGVPIVPVALKTDAWGNGRRPGRTGGGGGVHPGLFEPMAVRRTLTAP